ncbi:MAG: hypothetical protein K2M98_03750 [Muribaculum sp.]|nr:hypothetical protein [Muribaculum sp.]
MTLQELSAELNGGGRVEALARMSRDDGPHRGVIYGAAGSSIGMSLAALPKNTHPSIVVGDDPDDAGYLYHDLSRILGKMLC